MRIILVFICMLITLSLAAIDHTAQVKKYQFSAQKMGTTFRLVFFHSSASEARELAELAFQEIDSLNMILSDYLPDSEINRLSASAGNGNSIPVSDDLWNVLLTAQEISTKSNGAFDISIGPLSKLWRRAFRRGEFPDWNKIQQAKALVNFRWIKLNLNKQEVTLEKSGMRLDLGGIAKGYTVDQTLTLLREHGVTAAVVDGGGDIRITGQPPDGHNWKIQGIEDLIFKQDQAFASSGDTYRYLEWQGIKYSHIIDPRNGLGVSKGTQTVVMAPTCMLADALASAINIMGVENAEKLLKYFGAKLVNVPSPNIFTSG